MAELQAVEQRQYLSFSLDAEQYALEVFKVREVLEYEKPTKMPRMPEYMRGVINLRGSVVPVVDLRRKFGLPLVEPSIETRIIVMEIAIGEDSITLGAIADRVHEVLELDSSLIQPAPTMGKGLRSEFLKGVARQEDQLLILLDIDKIFSSEDVELLGENEDS